MTLASGGSSIFLLVVYQIASSIDLGSSAVTPAGFIHKSRGDNVGPVEERMCVVRSILLLPLVARCLETIDEIVMEGCTNHPRVCI